MFNTDMSATARYRIIARGKGCVWARALHASQRARAGSCDSQPRDAGGPRRLIGASEARENRCGLGSSVDDLS